MNTQQDHEISNIKSSSEPVLSVGQTLREARERMGLSANDVANRIKFATKQIEWLEADDYIRLPEAAFVRGFVRSYARLLELDAAQLLTGLPSSHVRTSSIPEVKSVDIPLPSTLNGRRHNIIWLAAALIIAVSVAVFERMHSRSPDQPQVGETPTVQVLDLPVEAGVNDAPTLMALPENATPDPERVPEVLQTAKPQLAAETAVKPVVVKQAESVAPVVVPKKICRAVANAAEFNSAAAGRSGCRLCYAQAGCACCPFGINKRSTCPSCYKQKGCCCSRRFINSNC